MAKFTKLIKDGSGGGNTSGSDILTTMFYLTDGTYTRGITFPKGLTWSQFCQPSGASYPWFYCGGGYVYYACNISTGEYRGGGQEVLNVTPDTVIEEGKTYYLRDYGGGSLD